MENLAMETEESAFHALLELILKILTMLRTVIQVSLTAKYVPQDTILT
jgi:hypothetical protein